MTGKLKIKFLTVVWGARYVEEFSKLSLPSYLAPGNLPFVALETDLEIVILTSAASRSKFEEQPIFGRLRALCAVRYIFIDDLITTGNYGVTLTLAYARGIRDAGAEQTNINFVFMNSDFVLADGSLKTLVAKLREGHRCIMAPSLRACSETAIPQLLGAFARADQALVMSSRSMVQIAFDNLHPTVIAKTITQNFVTCRTHNQIYWQVDENTLLGRYHLMFMLAIKPEVPMAPVTSYCDYGFVPELVPSKRFSVIGDSDGFFMLELQPSAQERNFLRCGIKTPGEIATELSSWTTSEHRSLAKVDVVFRSSEVTDKLARVRMEAAQFVKSLHDRMVNPALSHVNHFYWMFGVQAWSSSRSLGHEQAFPPELGPAPPQRLIDFFIGLLGIARRMRELGPAPPQRLIDFYVGLLGIARRMRGVVPDVPIWSHLWLDSRLLINWIRALKVCSKRNLLVCDEGSPFPISLRKFMQFDLLVGLDELSLPTVDQRKLIQEPYDNVIIHIDRAKVPKSRGVLQIARNHLKPDGIIAAYIEFKNAETDQSNFSFELAAYVEDILPVDWLGYRINASFAGGRLKRRLQLIEKALVRHLIPSSLRKVPQLVVAATLWPVVVGLVAAHNFWMRNTSAKCPEYCTSALLCLTRIPGPQRRCVAARTGTSRCEQAGASSPLDGVCA